MKDETNRMSIDNEMLVPISTPNSRSMSLIRTKNCQRQNTLAFENEIAELRKQISSLEEKNLKLLESITNQPAKEECLQMHIEAAKDAVSFSKAAKQKEDIQFSLEEFEDIIETAQKELA